MDTKNYRKDLFIQLDGIALIAPIYSIFNSSLKIFEDLSNSSIRINNLKDLNVNLDYLNVTLRLFESQGFLKRIILDNDTLNVKITDKGKEFFKDKDLYIHFFKYFDSLSKISLTSTKTTSSLTNYLKDFNNIKVNNEITRIHLKGLLFGPVIVCLFMNNLATISKDDDLILSKKINIRNKDFIYDLFKTLKFIKSNNKLNEEGLFFCKRSSAYGVTVSYMPLFSKINYLLFDDSTKLLNRDKNGNELHVNRKMNVWGSGGAPKLYFKKIDEIIINIFNRPIELQPKGIADMGCGDGTMLIHLYKLVKEKTKRGKLLDKHPLHIVGADFNNEALDITYKNLTQNKINPILIKADIGNPEDFNNKLYAKHNIKLNDLLNVRSFLDHNRIFEMPMQTEFSLNQIKTKSTAAFCTNNHNKILEPKIFKLSLVEHFVKWKPYINKFGLILLELHTIHPELSSKNIGSTVATAYDATHGYSNQYIIEYDEFIDASKIAGLKNDINFEYNFPSKELTTVSINLITV